MKQQILERARSTVEGFLHRQCTALTVLSVDPEVDGYGDELPLIRFTCDDGNDAKGLTFISAWMAKSRRTPDAVARKRSIAVRALLMSAVTLDLLNG